MKLAGPRLLTRLTGEAWKATEHLSIVDLRGENGWLKVLQALDAHYKYLPETELNECVDDFLFYLKKRPNEGATAFTSRFKSTLSRLETLVAADKSARKQAKAKRKRRRAGGPRSPSTTSSSTESSDISSGIPEPLTKEKVEAQAAAAAAAPKDGAKTVGSFVGESSPKPGKKKTRSQGSADSGSQKADDDKAQRTMLQQLEKLEVGHMKLKAIFPEVVLGHLYMKKYGLTREQRTAVVRASGGSSRFKDVERIMRASDFEDRRPEAHRGQGSKGFRREAVLEAGEDSQSMSEPSLAPSDEEIHEADLETEDDETAAELQEIFEGQKKAKANVKKFDRDYRTSRKKVKEIKKSRQGYLAAVAIPPDSPGPVQAPVAAPTFKYDRKGGKDDGRRNSNRPKKEEVNLLSCGADRVCLYGLRGPRRP